MTYARPARSASPFRVAPLAALLVSAALAGCAQDTTRFPSLGLRAGEKIGFAEPEVKTVEAAPDPALDAELATLKGKLDDIARGFARDAGRAAAAARTAKDAPVGSEAWITAQTALAGLDDWRAQASSLVTDIDARATDRAAALKPPDPALTTLRDTAQAEADRQGATIARIQDGLPSA